MVAIRKAGDLPELINAAIRARGYEVVNPADEFDWDPLRQQMTREGSALLRPNDLRGLMSAAESRRRVAEMSPQERLARIGEYLSSMEGVPGAPMIFPVTQGRGADMRTLAASVIDGDRLISYALQAPGASGNELLFIPGAAPASVTHVAEKVVTPDGPEHFEGREPVFHYGTMPTDTARAIYKQAVSNGYRPTQDGPLQEEFYYDTDLIHAPGPGITQLYRAISGMQPQPAPQQSRPVYGIPMKFAYGSNAIPGTAPTTFDAILAGQRTSTLRKPGQIPDYVQPGSLVTVYDDRGRRQVVEITGRRMVDPSMVEELSQTERWTPEFLANYINRVGGGQLEQLLYRMPGAT